MKKAANNRVRWKRVISALCSILSEEDQVSKYDTLFKTLSFDIFLTIYTRPCTESVAGDR